MNVIAGSAVAAAVFVTASTVSAPAAQLRPPPSGAPISIGYCTVSEVPESSVEGGFQGLGSANLMIGFVNRAGVAATGVRFLVRIGNTSQTIEDKGSFAVGIPIEHVFTPLSSTAGFGDASCAVESATFSDGTRWPGEIARRPGVVPEQRAFVPDYANALSVQQMTAAWEAELARVFPQPVTGGG